MCGYVEQLSPEEAQCLRKGSHCLGDCHAGDQPAPKTQGEKGCSVPEEAGQDQAFMGSDLAFLATLSCSSAFMVFAVS